MDKKIENQITLRIYDNKFLDKLNEDYVNSKFNTTNKYLSNCLKIYLDSKLNLKKEIEFINNILNDKNLVSEGFENELIGLLKDLVRKSIINEELQLQQLGLLRRMAFDYNLYESDYNAGLYKDSLPQRLRDNYNE